jgi:hypothetical protein
MRDCIHCIYLLLWVGEIISSGSLTWRLSFEKRLLPCPRITTISIEYKSNREHVIHMRRIIEYLLLVLFNLNESRVAPYIPKFLTDCAALRGVVQMRSCSRS